MSPAIHAAGLRRATATVRKTTALADDFGGLPEGVTRWRVAAALRAAARPMGLTGPMLRLLEHYIDLTYDQDWQAGSEPVITRPLIEIAEHLGRSERQIRNIEYALAEKGLLAWRDSGNHHRKGRRDRQTGRLIYAYGPSLAPLGARADELLRQAAAARAEIAARRRLRLAIAALRRRIRAGLATAPGSTSQPLADAFARLPDRTPAGLTHNALAARRDALCALAADVDALSKTPQPANAESNRPDQMNRNTSSKAEIFRRHITETTSIKSMNGYCNPPRKSRSDGGASHVPVAIAMMATGPDFRAAMDDAGRPTLATLADAARLQALMMGIHNQQWIMACQRIGRYGATLAIIAIDRGLTRQPYGAAQPIREPAAYLQGLLGRAAAGTLRLDRTIFGLAHASAAEQAATDDGRREPAPPCPGHTACRGAMDVDA